VIASPALRAHKRLRTMLSLGRWLGPWTDGARMPEGVTREEIDVPAGRGADRPMRISVYRPAGPARGSLLLVPGLHYLGPADPRMDRFARVLAASGIVTAAPHLPDYLALIPTRALFHDVERALDALLALPGRPPGRPGVFSISFGSLPALALAASRGDAIGALVVFGGYARFTDTLEFCIRGRPGAAHDPLNRPVVFMNLLPWLPGKPEDPAPLLAAWRRYVEATWGRPAMKADAAWRAAAEEAAAGLSPSDRSLFLRSTGAWPGGDALFDEALAAARDEFAWLDPGPFLRDIRVPVHVVHGAEDDVIPHEHALSLARAMPPGAVRGVHVTGLYGHTQGSGMGAGIGKIRALAHEAGTLVQMLAALAAAGVG
jgi:pimeloyl-ACP methyl ester carboxylesterase